MAPPLLVFQLLSSGIADVRRLLFPRSMRNGLPDQLVLAANEYLRRWDERFQKLVLKLMEGKFFSPWPRVEKPARKRPEKPQTGPMPKPDFQPLRLPRRFGWFSSMVRPDAYHFAAQLQMMLDAQDMTALLAATPQAGRMLRALCRMMGVKAPCLALPKPQAASAAPRAARSKPAAAKKKRWRWRDIVPMGRTFPLADDEEAWAEWLRRAKRYMRKSQRSHFKPS